MGFLFLTKAMEKDTEKKSIMHNAEVAFSGRKCYDVCYKGIMRSVCRLICVNGWCFVRLPIWIGDDGQKFGSR